MEKKRKFTLSLNKKTISSMQANHVTGASSIICGTGGCPPAPSLNPPCDKK